MIYVRCRSFFVRSFIQQLVGVLVRERGQMEGGEGGGRVAAVDRVISDACQSTDRVSTVDDVKLYLVTISINYALSMVYNSPAYLTHFVPHRPLPPFTE